MYKAAKSAIFLKDRVIKRDIFETNCELSTFFKFVIINNNV